LQKRKLEIKPVAKELSIKRPFLYSSRMGYYSSNQFAKVKFLYNNVEQELHFNIKCTMKEIIYEHSRLTFLCKSERRSALCCSVDADWKRLIWIDEYLKIQPLFRCIKFWL